MVRKAEERAGWPKPGRRAERCVGIGGETQPRIMRTKRDENFEGRYFKYVGAKMHTARWWQTSYFKKANDNFHFMRIR